MAFMEVNKFIMSRAQSVQEALLLDSQGVLPSWIVKELDKAGSENLPESATDEKL